MGFINHLITGGPHLVGTSPPKKNCSWLGHLWNYLWTIGTTPLTHEQQWDFGKLWQNLRKIPGRVSLISCWRMTTCSHAMALDGLGIMGHLWCKAVSSPCQAAQMSLKVWRRHSRWWGPQVSSAGMRWELPRWEALSNSTDLNGVLITRYDTDMIDMWVSLFHSDLRSCAFLQAASVIADGAEEGTRADIYREEVGYG